jgi:hypothetical protein
MRLVRQASGVRVELAFRACGGDGPLALFATQRRRSQGSVVAEAKFTRLLPRGRTAPSLGAASCRDYGVRWPLARKFFGAGWVIVILRLVDSSGSESKTPSWAVRAPRG